MNWREFLESKKAKGFMVGLLALALTQFMGLSEGQAAKVAEQVVLLTMTYLGAQGVADFGKEKAKAEADAAAVPPATGGGDV